MNLRKLILLEIAVIIGLTYLGLNVESKPGVLSQETQSAITKEGAFWFLLHRKSNIEVLYHGQPGEESESTIVKTFNVKVGEPGKKPTPLPSFLGKEYWLITQKHDVRDNSEIGPYFLTLDIPVTGEPPFGPQPYLECDGQCDWEIPGSFGLHGISGNEEKLSSENPGSSGCIRHSDEDITYLYSLLEPEKEEIRFYIEDN